MPVMPGMKIKTDTPLVMKAREGMASLVDIHRHNTLFAYQLHCVAVA